MKKQSGFTLLETMCSVLLLGVVGAVLIESFTFLHQVARSMEGQTFSHHKARMVFLELARDIRGAGEITCDPELPHRMLLNGDTGTSVIYLLSDGQILRTDRHRTRVMAEGVDGLSFSMPETNSPLVHIVLKSTQRRHGTVVTNSHFLDVSRRNGGVP